MAMPREPNSSPIELNGENAKAFADVHSDASPHDIAQRRLIELVQRLGGGDSQFDDLDSAAADEVVEPIDIDTIARLRLVDRIAALEDDGSAAEPVSPAISEPAVHRPDVTDAGTTLDLGALRKALVDMSPAPERGAESELEPELNIPALEAQNEAALAPQIVQSDTPTVPIGEAAAAPAAEARLAELIRHQRTLLDRLTTIEPDTVTAPAIPESWQPPPLPRALSLPAPAAAEPDMSAPTDKADPPRLIDLLKPVPEPAKAEAANTSLIDALAVAKPKEQLSPPLPPRLRLPSAATPQLSPPSAAPIQVRRQPPSEPQRDSETAEGRSPMIIERARAEMSAKSTTGASTQVVMHPSGIPGLLAGLAASIVIAVLVYGSV